MKMPPCFSSLNNLFRAAFTLGCIYLGVWGAALSAAKEPPPNILFIVADDLGWADVGYHGSEIETPNLDRLAHDGLRLENHYVTPLCSSTRAGLLSGRFPSRFGVLGATNSQAFPFGTVTLASALKSRGYDTSITGKWHLGSMPEWGPLQFGFNHSHGSLAGGVDQYGHYYKDGPYRKTWHRDDQYIEQEGHATDLIAQEAIRTIEAERDGPFFIYVAFTAVHVPLQEPREWLRRYDGKINRPSRKMYAACATHMDDAIGQLVEAVQRSGQRENTLIVFTSDNGGHREWFDTERYGGGQMPCPILGNNLPLRGWKMQLYEGGIRVPAFVNWPGVFEPGELDAPIHVVDWFPTLTQLAGYQPDASELKLDGRNIWPQLLGQVPQPEPRTMYWLRDDNYAAVRHGDWKLITGEGEKFELFNVDDDPSEENNLASAQPQRVVELRTILAQQQQLDR